MSLDPSQLRQYVVVPVLERLRLDSMSAVELLMGTAAQESHLGKYIKQIKGPALGIYQMEPDTWADIYQNYLAYRPDLLKLVDSFRGSVFNGPEEMISNLAYATAMARVHYLRVPKSLPPPGDVEGLGTYWKNYYNSRLGKGTVEEFVQNYDRFCI